MMVRLVAEKRDLLQQRDSHLKQVKHLSEEVADLKLQLDSMIHQDQYRTQLYGIRCTCTASCLLFHNSPIHT